MGAVDEVVVEEEWGLCNTSPSSMESGQNPGILQESNGMQEFQQNSSRINRIPSRFLAYKYRKSTT
jgi:hypothetical protein